MREKRRSPRAPVVVRCDFRFGEKSREAYLTSFSEGGAYLVTNERLAVGDKIHLESRLPWELGELETEAKVVYVISESDPRPANYPPGAGLAFVELSDAEKEMIRQYVSRFHELAARLSSSEP